MHQLNNSTLATARQNRPIRILQFGEGNFLRAFIDWMITISNKAGVTNASIAVVTPRFRKSEALTTLQAQDCLYHVVLEGYENGQAKRSISLVDSIAKAFTPLESPELYREIITSPELQIVVSNTTEAGIRYAEDNILVDAPTTFPGKVTNLLWYRYNHFNGAAEKGLLFLCCELIEDNGSTLKEYVLRHAREAKLPEAFCLWVDTACAFCDTLVDRIVPGFPVDTINQIKEEIGYDDNALVKGELYHLWAIGGSGYQKAQELLPLDKAGMNVLFMPSIKAFRDKKVRILNGSHTGLVPIALQLGCSTVLEAFSHPLVNRFINDMVAEEVLPMIDEDPEQLKQFADSILERFYNPYVKHMLKSIALNSLSKWEARNWSTVKDNWLKGKQYAERELITFAALLSLYGPGSGFEPEDNPEHLAKIKAAWNDNDYRSTVATIIGSGIFLENFEETVPGFTDKVADYLNRIRTNGMENTLKQFLSV